MIWSFTFLNDLANCPFKAWRKHVKKDLPPEPESPAKAERERAMRDGITTHKLLEDYINGPRLRRLPVELEAHAKPLVEQGARAEVKLGMTREMGPASFNRGDPWGRGKLDVLIMYPPAAVIFDWKTGKVREDDRELKIQSMLLRANHPEITRVSGAYVWLKEGRMGVWRDLTDINRTYHGTVASMAEAESYGDNWPCKPNALCSYCPVLDCRFNSVDKYAQSAMAAP